MTTTDINTDATDTQGLWVTISDLARMRGIDKAAVSRRVARFVNDRLVTPRSGPRGTKLINLAEYDRAAGLSRDAIRELASSPADAGASKDPVLAREQARRMAYQADLAKLELDERLGKLVSAEGLEDIAKQIGEAWVRVVERLPTNAEAVAEAVSKEGTAGARRVLKGIASEIRAKAAEQLLRIASLDPAHAPEGSGREGDHGA